MSSHPIPGGTVLERFPVNPVLPARDGDRARAFYRDTLGLVLLSGPADDPMMFRAGRGSTIVVSEMPERVPPPYPVTSFLVSDLEAVVGELLTRGVRFHDAGADRGSFAGTRGAAQGAITDYGAVRSAFLYDSEDNMLALNEVFGLDPTADS
jgi:catechol 2,3-dioxygenase-like lactoylglutathione lyase family enzyme